MVLNPVGHKVHPLESLKTASDSTSFVGAMHIEHKSDPHLMLTNDQYDTAATRAIVGISSSVGVQLQHVSSAAAMQYAACSCDAACRGLSRAVHCPWPIAHEQQTSSVAPHDLYPELRLRESGPRANTLSSGLFW